MDTSRLLRPGTRTFFDAETRQDMLAAATYYIVTELAGRFQTVWNEYI